MTIQEAMTGGSVLVQRPCDLCNGEGDICDQNTKRVRPCPGCKTLGWTQRRVSMDDFICEIARQLSEREEGQESKNGA